MARYDVLLDGMMAASQTTSTPWFVMDKALMPRPRPRNGRAPFAPLGLRRIQAALVRDGFDTDNVAVSDDAHLDGAIGSQTQIVAISSGEPTGVGMSSTTMAGVTGGKIHPQVMFTQLLEQVRRLVALRCPQAKIVLGGPGAWQLAQDPALLSSLGLDHVVVGYAEKNVAKTFTDLLNATDLPPVIHGAPPTADGIPPILGPTTMGVVEISRGCGLGCNFCTLAGTPMIDVPPETVIADVRTNIAAGIRSIAALSEDFFRYGADGARCRPEAAMGLLARLRETEGLRLIQIDHANVSSIAQYTDEQLAWVAATLVGDTGSRHPWVNVGVETASADLLRRNGGGPKMAATGHGQWSEQCGEQLRRLGAAGFIPMASLMVGLPGESQDDVQLTLDWVRSLTDAPVTIFPVLYAPLDSAPPGPADLTRLQWRLVRECYEFNFKWVPRLYWDSQTGAGVGVLRRMMFQVLGRAQVPLWRFYLAGHARRAVQ